MYMFIYIPNIQGKGDSKQTTASERCVLQHTLSQMLGMRIGE